MKKILLLCLWPLFSLAQTQIGNDINGESAFSASGKSVSLSSNANVLAIGAPSNNGGGVNSGQVRIYQRFTNSWTQLGMEIEGEAAGDALGTSVSLSADGSILAIGAPYSNANGTYSGYVKVYQNSNGNWTQLGTDILGNGAGDYFGIHLSLSSDGTIIAIGAPGNDDSKNNAGQVKILQYEAGTWTQIGADINGQNAGNEIGHSVSLSADGSTVAIGAPFSNNNGVNSGHVMVFQNTASVWTQIGTQIEGENAGDQSGEHISLSADGNIIAIGAPYNDGSGSNVGHVKVLQNIENSWIQLGVNITGENNFDRSGSSVSLSADGSILAIGAANNNGNGSASGHTRVYQYNSSSWTQIGQDIDGEAAGDWSGYSVSLSASGNVLAIGAPFNDGSASEAGHVRLYDLINVLSNPSFSKIDFKVYPNPAQNNIYIQLKEGVQLEEVNLYSILGELVYKQSTNMLSVSELAHGHYFVEVITNQGKGIKKVIVN